MTSHLRTLLILTSCHSCGGIGGDCNGLGGLGGVVARHAICLLISSLTRFPIPGNCTHHMALPQRNSSKGTQPSYSYWPIKLLV